MAEASTAQLAASGPELLRALVGRGYTGDRSTLYRILGSAACPFDRPTRKDPLDVATFEAWCRTAKPRLWKKQVEPAATDNGDGELGDDDPYKPPPPEVLRRLRQLDPGEWALVLQRIQLAEARRIENERRLGQLLERSEVDRAQAAKIVALRSSLRQMAKALAPGLADLLYGKVREELQDQAAIERIARALGRVEGQVEALLIESFERLCDALAEDSEGDGEEH